MSSSTSPLLLHIGYPKAASTWLQRHFFQGPQGFGQVFNPLLLHRDLVLPAEADLDMAALSSGIGAEISRQREQGLMPVISSESLCGDLLRGGSNGGLIAARLAKVLDGESRVLLITREQRDFIRSAYKTLVMFGAERSLRAMLDPPGRGAANHFHLGFLHYDRVVGRYESLFGAGSVCVLPYELFREQPRSFLDAVRAHIGQAPLSDAMFAALSASEVTNPGQSLARLHLQRFCNRLARTAADDYRGRRGSNDYDTVMQRIARHKQRSSSTPLDSWLERRFQAQVAAGVQGVFEATNRRLQAHCQYDLAAFGYRL